MDSKTRSIVIGAVALIILAAITGTAIYVGKAAKNKAGEQKTADGSLSGLPVVPADSSITPGVTAESGNRKNYQGLGFIIPYPKSWGLLTCANSRNFELDPTDETDLKNIKCDFALKPVTVLVGKRSNCLGESVKLGNNQVIRSKTITADGGIDYHWCVNMDDTALDITHRVSSLGSRATSKEDFSLQVEQMIGEIKTSAVGGS